MTLYITTSFKCHFDIYAHTYVSLKLKNCLRISNFSSISIVFKEGSNLLQGIWPEPLPILINRSLEGTAEL